MKLVRIALITNGKSRYESARTFDPIQLSMIKIQIQRIHYIKFHAHCQY